MRRVYSFSVKSENFEKLLDDIKNKLNKEGRSFSDFIIKAVVEKTNNDKERTKYNK